jgi:hypothetical protein
MSLVFGTVLYCFFCVIEYFLCQYVHTRYVYHYVIVSDLRQICGFRNIVRFQKQVTYKESFCNEIIPLENIKKMI